MNLFTEVTQPMTRPYQRELVTILFDTSESMGWEHIGRKPTTDASGRTPITVLQEEVPTLVSSIDQRLLNVDIALGEFYGDTSGAHVRWYQPESDSMTLTGPQFHSGESLRRMKRFPVVAGGTTPIAHAFETAINSTLSHATKLANEVPPVALGFRPAVCIFSDGLQQGEDSGASDRAMELVKRLDGRVNVYACATPAADRSLLERICGNPPIVLEPSRMTDIVHAILHVTTTPGAATEVLGVWRQYSN